MPSNPQLVFGCILSIVFEIISSSIVSKQNNVCVPHSNRSCVPGLDCRIRHCVAPVEHVQRMAPTSEQVTYIRCDSDSDLLQSNIKTCIQTYSISMDL